MDWLSLPAPPELLLVLPDAGEQSMVLPALTDRSLSIPAPSDATLVLNEVAPLDLVLSADLIPKVPGIAAGSVAGEGAVAGGVGSVIAKAVGSVLGDGYVVQATASVIVKVTGVVSGAASVTGRALLPATGSVSGAGTLSGVARAVLSGVVSAAASVSGAARRALSGSVTGAGTITGSARAVTSAAGSVTGAGTVSGTAVRAFIAMGAYLTTTGRYEGSNNTWAQITSLAARTDYPSTVLNSNRLQLITPAPTKLTARAAWSGNGNNVGIAVNGTLVAFSSAGTSAQTVTYTYTAAVGDLVSLVTNPGNSSVGNRTIQSGQTVTYLTADPA